jgi:hypothetical protein
MTVPQRTTDADRGRTAASPDPATGSAPALLAEIQRLYDTLARTPNPDQPAVIVQIHTLALRYKAYEPDVCAIAAPRLTRRV